MKSKHVLRRLFARGIDTFFVSLLFSPGLALFFWHLSFNAHRAQLGASLVLAAFLVPVFCSFTCLVEAACFQQFQTTIGKKWLGIEIRTASSSALDSACALRRSLLVCIHGFAFGVPILSWLTLIRAFLRMKKAPPYWDSKLELIVTYHPISCVRFWSFPVGVLFVIAAVACFIRAR